MRLTDEDIREFQAIWKAEFNEDISPEQARAEGMILLDLYMTCGESMVKKGGGAGAPRSPTEGI